MNAEPGRKETNLYEKIYYDMWELAGRYQSFCQFRIIGETHDQRMIPMLELGTGADMIFCVSGFFGTQQKMPEVLVKMAEEYCRAYECNWKPDEFYEVKKLLDKVRICLIPLGNPDGYVIGQGGFENIRNPVFRQMLRMQSISSRDYDFNARGIDISRNFPTFHYVRSRMGDEPGSENETKAIMRILQEYRGRGLLFFEQSGREIIYYHSRLAAGNLPRSYRLARCMQKKSAYRLQREQEDYQKKIKGMGTIEQYYMQTQKQPAFRIKVPAREESANAGVVYDTEIYEEIHLLPLEYIFSLEA